MHTESVVVHKAPAAAIEFLFQQVRVLLQLIVRSCRSLHTVSSVSVRNTLVTFVTMRRFRGQKAERGGALKLGLKALKKSRCIQSGSNPRPFTRPDHALPIRPKRAITGVPSEICVYGHLSLKYCSEVAVPTTATVLRTRRFPAVLETHGERQSLPDRVSVRAESCPNTRLSIPERFSPLPHLYPVSSGDSRRSPFARRC